MNLRLWSREADRGVSDVLGVILVVSVVLVGVVAVVGFGVTGVTDTSDISDTAVERDLTAFAQEVDRLAVHRTTDRVGLDLSMASLHDDREWVAVDEREGSIELAVQTGDGTETLLSEPLGHITYESPRSDARIAYQSGLVLSSPGDSATPGVVRSNAFTHRVDTHGTESLTLHIIQSMGIDQFDTELAATVSAVEVVHPDGLLDGESLVLRLSTAYPGGWELAMREVFPAEATIARVGTDELEIVYDIPAEGLFLHAFRHEVAIDGR